MQKIRKILSFFLAIMMMLSIIPITASAEAITGSCGDNLTWTFDDSTGTLTISGTGAMNDYASNNRPWEIYEYNIKNVIINNGVTTIGGFAFGYCDSLMNVTISDSVTIIGGFAFGFCESLKRITVPDSVTTIDNYAFYGCKSLTSVTFPDSVTIIGGFAFGFCENLTSVTIPNSVTKIGEYAFYKCTSLTNIVIPDSVTTIGYGTFSGCNSLESITIPDSVTTIDDGAFYWCDSLKSVTIPDSVITIGDSAFSHCYSLTSVVVGNSITIIGNETFYSCTSLTDVYYTGKEEGWGRISINSGNDTLLNANIHYEHSHSFTFTKKTLPTCTKHGYTTYTCECGSSYRDDYIDAIGHTEKELSAVEPTCIKTGLTSGVECSVCGEILIAQQKIPTNGHKYDSVVTQPTCTMRGYTIYVCYCGHSYTSDFTNALGHNYKFVITLPTCTEQGYTVHTCSNCSDSYIDNYVEATGHKYNSVVTNPTCTESGYTTCTCECGDTYIANITPVTGHNDSDNDGYCETCDKLICSHSCHKTGFEGFFWKIANFFNKLFGSNKYCDCGATHY